MHVERELNTTIPGMEASVTTIPARLAIELVHQAASTRASMECKQVDCRSLIAYPNLLILSVYVCCTHIPPSFISRYLNLDHATYPEAPRR